MIRYLSPSSIKMFQESAENFYKRYIAPVREIREPQTLPMSVGSAFDAYAKSNLYKDLFGKREERFEFDKLFESQVEIQNRDWANKAGFHAFSEYRDCGAYSDLLLQLTRAQSEPQFEISIEGKVSAPDLGIEGIPFLGKPDLYFIGESGHTVILDWKVNGYCSKSLVSPKPGYINLREKDGPSKIHPKCVIGVHKGWQINTAATMEQIEKDWAAQLSIYSWLCGEPVGTDCVVGIDQLACGPGPVLPKIRVASHRCLVDVGFQRMLLATAADIWDRVAHGHFFREVSKEESDLKCEMLNQVALDSTTEEGQEFRDMYRSKTW